jgi:DNA-binding SARP family transcriptional activator
MAFDKRAYLEDLLVKLHEELAKANTAKEGYEEKVERWDVLKEQIELHIEAVQEFLDDLP